MAAARARDLLARLSIRNPAEIQLENIAWNCRVLVEEIDMTGADGRTIRRKGKTLDAIMSVRRGIQEPRKKRFVIAHELGHFLMHPDRNQFRLCRDKDFLLYRKILPEEAEANAFAVELLMPESLYRPRCEKPVVSIEQVALLADLFQVTFISAAFRFVDFCPERCAFVVSRNGSILWCKFSDGVRHSLGFGQGLHPDTHAHDYFTDGVLPHGHRQVPCAAWGFSGPDRLVFEESFSMPQYNSVATLLWDRDGDDWEDGTEEGSWRT